MNQTIDLPSVELVQEYISKFDGDKELVIVEEVLSELFGKYPNNQELCDILIKAAALNSLYNTHIFAIVKMANHIHKNINNLDARLRSGSIELVDDIALLEVGNNKKRRNYSFASKYCHWHQPNIYPIYDSYVENIIWKYRKQDKNFMMFKRTELQQYERYKEIIDGFREHYRLTKFNYRQIDKFLWMYSKRPSEKK